MGRKAAAPAMTAAAATQPITGLRIALITIILSNTIQRPIRRNTVPESTLAAGRVNGNSDCPRG
jgi:hypothetical protein